MSRLSRITADPVGAIEFGLSRLASRLPAPAADRIWGMVLKRSIEQGRSVLVNDEQLSELYRSALVELGLDRETGGSYLEFGVFVGTSLAAMHHTARSLGIPLTIIGFDSFRGLPASVRDDDGGWKPGSFYSPERVTRWNLEANHGLAPHDYELVKGWFDESLATFDLADRDIERIDIVMLDADAYSSTAPVLEWMAPRLAQKTIVIFDDWHWVDEADPEGASGVERAFDEWCAARPEVEVEPFGDYSLTESNGTTRPAGRAFIVRRPPSVDAEVR